MQVDILNRQRGHDVDRGALGRLMTRLCDELPPPPVDSMTVCLVSDRRMRELNRQFRGHDRTTDVLSFPAGDVPASPPGERHLGDVVISVATAARQAIDEGHSLDDELGVLAVHGYLHLLGYDHETDRGEMVQLQARLVRTLLGRRRTRR